jgi:NTP pyrophosphatase (non-canonical NTP hydrolase)
MHSNDLNSVQEELVGLLQEEAAELIQGLSKIRRVGTQFKCHGGEETNQDLLMKELVDVLLLVDMAFREGVFDDTFDIEAYVEYKKEKLKKWTNLPHSLIESI